MYNMHSVPARGLTFTGLVARFATVAQLRTTAVVKAFGRGVARRLQYRRDLMHLQAMDDRQLEDIGVERRELHSVVGHAPWFIEQPR